MNVWGCVPTCEKAAYAPRRGLPAAQGRLWPSADHAALLFWPLLLLPMRLCCTPFCAGEAKQTVLPCVLILPAPTLQAQVHLSGPSSPSQACSWCLAMLPVSCLRSNDPSGEEAGASCQHNQLPPHCSCSCVHAAGRWFLPLISVSTLRS